MKLFSSLVLTGILLMSATAPDSWSERLKDWLPEFVTEWWWPDPEQEPSVTLDPALLARPEAEAFLATPATIESAYQLNWPFTVLETERSQARWVAVQQGAVLLQNDQLTLPLKKGTPIRFIYPANDHPVYFSGLLRTYGPINALGYNEQLFTPLQSLVTNETTTVIFSDANRLKTEQQNWFTKLSQLPATAPVVLVHFGDSRELPELPENWSVILVEDRNLESESFTAQALFGGMSITGTLSNRVGEYAAGTGIRMNARSVGFASPETVGVDRKELEKVDYYVKRAIRKRAMPGAQLAVVKDGKVIYQKSYGNHTYRRKQEVYSSDLYDLASITKAGATSLAVMKLYDGGELELDKKVQDYLPMFLKRPLGRYTIEQLLTHQTGIQANLPLYDYLGKQFIKENEDDGFSVRIGKDRWLDNTVHEGIIQKLKVANYTKRRIFRYSDVNYVLLQLIIEEISGQTLDQYLATEVYGPLGLDRLQFRPFENFPENQMVPTVVDNWMRGGLLRGYVHGEGASLLGGVAGHAGLFGNATDLAMLFQMLLNNGELNGERIFKEETVKLFTAKSRYNYRALGFDRLKGGWGHLMRRGAGEDTFGHLGFSGTSVWADPENNLVYVLLTNRVHPDGKNKKFMKLKVRGKVHEQIYRSLNTFTPAPAKTPGEA